LGWIFWLLMLMAVAGRGLSLLFRAAGLGVHVAGLGARVATHLSDRCCAWAWIGFPCCWAAFLVLLCWRLLLRAGLAWLSVLLDWVFMLLGWALALPKIFLTDAARGLGLVFDTRWSCRCVGRSCSQRSLCLVLFVGLD